MSPYPTVCACICMCVLTDREIKKVRRYWGYRGCLHGEVQGINKVPVFSEHEVHCAYDNAQDNGDDSSKHEQPVLKTVRYTTIGKH